MLLNQIKELTFSHFPKKKNIILFENIPNNVARMILSSKDYSFIFDNGNRKLNIFVLLSIFFKFKTLRIWVNDNLLTAYAFQYIFFTNPKIIISTGDNNLNHYRLKKYYKNIIFYVLQNGSRHYINDIFGNPELKNFNNFEKSADVIFTFNNSVSKLYQKLFKCKTIAVGKFVNNTFPYIFHNPFKKKIIYISQYRPENFKKKYFYSHGSKVCSIKKWTEVERRLMPILKKICEKKKIQITILGAAQTLLDKTNEKRFYNLYLGNTNWFYWNQSKDIKKRYNFVGKFEIVVCSWSTLGLEFFSRNSKVLFFSQKKIKNFIDDRRFGWPYPLPDKGYWYTNLISESEVKRLLENLLKISKSEWISKITPFKNKIMQYDHNNNKIKNIIKNF